MITYLLRRLVYAVPIALAVGFVCFMLVQIAPGDPINAIVPADAPADVVEQVRRDYGQDKPLPIQFGLWLWKVVQGDLGRSLATGRPVWADLSTAIGNTLMLAVAASLLGFVLGCVLGGLAGTFRGSLLDRAAVGLAVAGVSVPHYWLGMVLVVLFSVQWNLLPAMGAGPGGSSDWAWDWEHFKHLVLPTATLSVIPMGIVTRTVRGIVAEIMNQEFVVALRGKGLRRWDVFLHVVKNAAPNSLAVMGLHQHLADRQSKAGSFLLGIGAGKRVKALEYSRQRVIGNACTLVAHDQGLHGSIGFERQCNRAAGG